VGVGKSERCIEFNVRSRLYLVITGLLRVIPIVLSVASSYRDGRDRPGHDGVGVIPGRSVSGGEGNPRSSAVSWIPFPVLRTAGDDKVASAVDRRRVGVEGLEALEERRVVVRRSFDLAGDPA
jgi:hypothetical protein